MIKKLLILLLVSSLPGAILSQNIDIRLLRSFNSPGKLPSDNFFQIVSNTEAYIVAGIPVTTGVIGLIKNDDELFRNSCVAAAAIAINSGITLALKYSINRTRPFITYPDISKKSGAASPSFPSGHTSSSFALATSLSLSYPKWYVIAPSYLWAGTVAFSRMDLGVHYPSDVLAGALIGTGSAVLTHFINKKLILKSKKKPCNCPEF
jgi:membrane-associated phospholipid phosphatase